MKKPTGFRFLLLAVLAFVGLGFDPLLAYVIEPVLYGRPLNEWSDLHFVVHWIATCICWGSVVVGIVAAAKKICDFDLLQKGGKVPVWRWALIAVFVVVCLTVSYIEWGGSKVLKEWDTNGPVRFLFQYIYYVFEVMLVTLIIVLGQKAFECWFRRESIPYGGIIAAVTWGAGHFFTKDFLTGALCTIFGFALGSIYLIVNRDVRKAFPILWIMFVL